MNLAILALLTAVAGGATTHCITIAGLGGEPDYEQRFGAWSQSLDLTLREAPETRVHTLSGGNARRDSVRSVFQTVAREAKPEDNLVVVLIGHGTFDGIEYKINLPGPDISATELAGLLDAVKAGKQLIVNATSASGGSVHALLRQNRTVITATKSGTEKNATVFPRYWIEALRDSAADTDKNEVITALEAFQFAELKTKQFFETNKRLATEHATLDGGESEAALAAARFPLLRIGSIQKAASDPAKRELLDKREKLEADIDRLKFRKAAMPTDEYKGQLQKLLLELAQTQAEIDQ